MVVEVEVEVGGVGLRYVLIELSGSPPWYNECVGVYRPAGCLFRFDTVEVILCAEDVADDVDKSCFLVEEVRWFPFLR